MDRTTVRAVSTLFRAAGRLQSVGLLGNWTGRPLPIYFAAVVLPTVIILGLGIITVRRQHDALETLRLTNRALQQARIAEDLGRAMREAATAAFVDSAVEKMVERLSSSTCMKSMLRGRTSIRGKAATRSSVTCL
jgi:hypothetical protein